MSEGLRERVEDELRNAVRSRYGVELGQIVGERPPRTELGDLAFPAAFELARALKKAPRKIAEELEEALSRVDGVSRVEVAGAGYLNVFFDRMRYLEGFLAPSGKKIARGKVIVEHTNINPNKAAHIGHLRNAALGDTFVRALRFCGETVEVQNYIDDTGVQVADVVVGFLHLEKKTQAEVEALVASERFDYYCWDLYARVSQFFQGDRERLKLREHTLKAIEEGEAPEGPLGALIADKVVRCHLTTMDRIDVRYDLLPWESDILRLKFWHRAYELLKERKAIRLATAGKNQGCWVMDLGESAESEADPVPPDQSDEKVIVRSNGTVTYVGKDIAYQMWKLGLLDRQFGFHPFHRYPDGATVWSTTAESSPGAPDFGKGERVYNVIDVRQAYLQNVVQRGVALLASEEARERSHHFSYEMVALTPATCRELGFPVAPCATS
jgi:arginyl-tRNA synthetase